MIKNVSLTYEEFVESIENNDIEGSLDIDGIVNNDVFKKLKLMCQLNPKDRRIDYDEGYLYSKYPSSYDNDNNIWYMINQFDMKPYITILVYEICLRYKNICRRNIEWYEILSIIYIVEVYLTYSNVINIDIHFISGLKKENFLDLALNKCLSIIDNYNINMEDWLTDINEELLYKNRIKYLMNNEEIYILNFIHVVYLYKKNNK